MSRLQLVRILTGNQILTMTDRPGTRLEAKPGARYQLLDGASYKPVEEYIEKRKGYDLEIWLEDSLFVVIEDFFIPDMRAVMLPPEYGQPEPEVDEEYEALLASDESSGSAWQAYLTTGVAILGGGALGYSLFGNKDEESSGASNSVESLLSVTAVAGAFTSAATVRVYDAEGNLLGEGSLDPETGQVAIRLSIATDYSGAVLIVVSDANGSEDDYISEATGAGTSLDTDLRALATFSAGESLVVSATPITELAVRLAIAQAEMAADIESLAATPLTQDHLALNAALADLLGLEDVLGEVLTIDSDDFDASDDLTVSEYYGALLALFSGVDATQEGVDASLTALLASLTFSDGSVQMNSSGTELLQQGWEQFITGPNADLLETPPLIGDLPSVANREEGWVVKVPGAEFGDVLEITLGDQTFSTDVLPTTSQIENGTAIINIQPTLLESIGLGEHDLQVTNGEQVSPAVAVTLIEAPVALEITLGSDELGTGDASTIVTFTFSNTVEGFSPEEDINVSSGTLTDFAMTESERVWTAIYTPADGVQDTEVLISVSTDFTDGQGLAPQEESDGVAATGTIRVDTLNPTATLTLSTTHLSRGEEGTLTIVFSEPVQDFSIDDIELTGGLILGDLAASGDGVTWVVPISAPDHLEDVGTIDLNGEWQDQLGNAAGNVEPISVVIDTQPPAVTLTVEPEQLLAGQTAVVSEEFSEPVLNFGLEDLSSEVGTFSNLQLSEEDEGAGLLWTVTFTPDSDISEAVGAIQVLNGFTNAVGNAPVSFGGVVATQNVTLDTLAPTATLTLSPISLASGETATLLISFSEAVENFSEADIDTQGFGVISGLTALEGRQEWQATFTPSPDLEDETVTLSLGIAWSDAQGNLPSVFYSSNSISVDTMAPEFTSGSEAADVLENTGAGSLVYTATADDPNAIFSLAGVDAAFFAVDPSSGEVTLLAAPDFENKSIYAFSVMATDEAGNSTEQAVTLEVIDQVVEQSPVISSPATATAIEENSGAGSLVYTATSDDPEATYSIGGRDAALFEIDSASGEVTLLADADYETQPNYSFVVTAANESGSASLTVTMAVIDLDDRPPLITSPAQLDSVQEGLAANREIYQVTSDDPSASYSLSGQHAFLFDINEDTGVVTLLIETDHERFSVMNFNVVATDEAGNDSQLALSLGVVDQDESVPEFVGDDLVDIAVAENTSVSAVFYTAEVQDTADVDDDTDTTDELVFRLSGADMDQFSIDSDTGELRFLVSPDHEARTSYQVTVIAADAAGNEASQDLDITITDQNEVAVMIDLVNGASSLDEDGDRTFDADTSYSIYVQVDSDSDTLDLDFFNRWSGANRLGPDDRIILVGDDGMPNAPSGAQASSGGMTDEGVLWWGADQSDVAVTLEGATVTRLTSEASDSAIWLTGATWDSEAAPNQDLSPENWVIEEIPVEISEQFIWS